MKYKLYILLCAGLLLAGGCIKEEPENCGKYVWFEVANPKYTFPADASSLWMLVYDEEGNLADEHTWTRSELTAGGNKVFVPIPPAGDGQAYTLIALFNNAATYFSTEELQSTLTAQTSLNTENDSIKSYFTGNAFARKDNVFFNDTQHTRDTLLVSKNSNYIDLDLTIRDNYFPAGSQVVATLSGQNTVYDAHNLSIDTRHHAYLPYAIQESAGNAATSHTYRSLIRLKTMRIWRHDGLKMYLWLKLANGQMLPLTLTLEDGTRSDAIEVTETIARVKNGNGEYIYDTYEKLEREDAFQLQLTLEGVGLAVVSITINDWMLIAGQINV